MADKEKHPHKEVHFLRCDFTELEMKELSAELARGTNELAQAESDKKAVMSQFAERINSRKSEVSSLARRIANGYEMRTVNCEVRLHDPKKGSATVIRTDTGEIVKSRLMTPEESQTELFAEARV